MMQITNDSWGIYVQVFAVQWRSFYIAEISIDQSVSIAPCLVNKSESLLPSSNAGQGSQCTP